jgi:hypothetical protein
MQRMQGIKAQINVRIAKIKSLNKRYTLRRLFGGFGLRKTAVGLSPFVRFSLRHIWGRGSMLRIALYPTPNVVYLERYAKCQTDISEKMECRLLTKFKALWYNV